MKTKTRRMQCRTILSSFINKYISGQRKAKQNLLTYHDLVLFVVTSTERPRGVKICKNLVLSNLGEQTLFTC